MFKSATVRLTLWYLVIVMAISSLFSAAVYGLATNELQRGLLRQTVILHQSLLYGDELDPAVDSLPGQQYAIARDHIRDNLLLLNLIILVLAGGASFLLARRTLRPIEEAMEAQSRFTADASHELRTPLTAMRTEVEVALRDKQLDLPEAKQLLASNLEEIGKLEALSAGLLTLAHQDQNEPVYLPVELKAIVDQALAKLEPLIAKRKLTVKQQIKAGLLIWGNELRLVELAVVLIDNAIKYSDAGTSLTLSGDAYGHQVGLRVADQGQGIKPTDIPHLFDRFYRADSSRSKNQTSGYGLGLAIAKKIVDAHDGQIDVASTLGQGTTFTVTLPKPSKNNQVS